MSSLSLVCLSDTHTFHRHVRVPEGDVLVHAGDICSFYDPLERSMAVLEDFNGWLGELPHRHKIVIAGNHDVPFTREPERARALLTNAHYLENSGIELDGLRFWGSPITPVMGSMAFATERGAASREVWNRIPENTDVLVTHGPPRGILDQDNIWEVHDGCPSLLEAVRRVKPQAHIFGHIHGGWGKERSRDGTRFVNCSVFNARRELAHAPLIVELNVDAGWPTVGV